MFSALHNEVAALHLPIVGRHCSSLDGNHCFKSVIRWSRCTTRDIEPPPKPPHPAGMLSRLFNLPWKQLSGNTVLLFHGVADVQVTTVPTRLWWSCWIVYLKLASLTKQPWQLKVMHPAM